MEHITPSRSIFFLALLAIGLTLSSCKEDALAPSTPNPILTGPLTLNFGDVALDGCKDTVIRYDNTAGKSVTITSITFSDAAFVWTGTAFPVTLASGASVDVKIRYCPTAMEPISAKMIVSGTGGESVSVTLSGNGVEPLHAMVKTGSSFTIEDVTRDSIGGEISRSTTVFNVLADNVTIKGRSGVRRIVTNDPVYPSTLHVDYRSDGNVGLLVDEQSREWILFPIQGGAGASSVVMDTTIVEGGFSYSVRSEITTSFLGSETLTIKGQTFQASKIRMLNTTRFTFMGETEYGESESLVWWAPKLGFIAKTISSGVDDIGSPTTSEGLTIDFNLVQ